MIYLDEKNLTDKLISLVEYNSSFVNYDGVKKIQEHRDSMNEDSIKETEEFIENVKDNSFKNNPLIDALKKIRENQSNDKDLNPLSSINLNKLINGTK